MDKVKVLVAGPINSRFEALHTKLSNLQKSKSGPFHICFCVGSFFASSCSLTDRTNKEETLMLLRNGTPIPVYFCDVGNLPSGVKINSDTYLSSLIYRKGNTVDADMILTEEEGEERYRASDDNNNENIVSNESDIYELKSNYGCHDGVTRIAPNVYHLHGSLNARFQTADIINISVPNCEYSHITVAYIPPKVNISLENQKLHLERKINSPFYIGCDLLLSSEWGRGMASSNCLSDNDKDKLKLILENQSKTFTNKNSLKSIGSDEVADIVSRLRPRYHFAPSFMATTNDNSVSSFDSFFLKSLPYSNIPIASSYDGNNDQSNHFSPVTRFLAICPFLDTQRAKFMGKSQKFIHALGIEPLWNISKIISPSITDVHSSLPSPYLKDKFGLEHFLSPVNGLSNKESVNNNPNNYRGLAHKQKHISAFDGSKSCTLYLHKLGQDDEFRGQLTRDTILNEFQSYSCVAVHFPSPKGYSEKMVSTEFNTNNNTVNKFCFLQFRTHEAAALCLQSRPGEIWIKGMNFILKWSSNICKPTENDQLNSLQRVNKMTLIPPPPPIGAIGIVPPPIRKRRKKNRLSEVEASLSSTLFVYIPNLTQVTVPTPLLEAIRKLMHKTLIDALSNSGNKVEYKDDNANLLNNRCTMVTCDEPALQVIVIPLRKKPNCGFIKFASHAAATMGIATLTGNTDGGIIQSDIDGVTKSMHGVELWWANSLNNSNSQREQFDHESGLKDFEEYSQHGNEIRTSHQRWKGYWPQNERKECWFCLASPTCEKHLIISVLHECYITMPKGPVNEFHSLIVPINHSLSNNEETLPNVTIGAYMNSSYRNVVEIDTVKKKLRQHAKLVLEKDLFMYERAFPTRGGYHSHINCIPISQGLGPKLKEKMLSMAADISAANNECFNLEELPDSDIDIGTTLRKVNVNGCLEGYFYAEISCGDSEKDTKKFLFKKMKDSKFCSDVKKIDINEDNRHIGTRVKTTRHIVPLAFGREVLATVLGNDSIGNWKACVLDPKEEKELTIKFRESLSKF